MMYNVTILGEQLNIHDYHTDGGKNLIKEYLSSLPTDECRIGYSIRHNLIRYGLQALEQLDTRQLQGKLWEMNHPPLDT